MTKRNTDSMLAYDAAMLGGDWPDIRKSAMTKRTPWFDASTPPSRPGMYERAYGLTEKVCPTVRLCYWDGSNWSVPGDKEIISVSQDLKWRGLIAPVGETT